MCPAYASTHFHQGVAQVLQLWANLEAPTHGFRRHMGWGNTTNSRGVEYRVSELQMGEVFSSEAF